MSRKSNHQRLIIDILTYKISHKAKILNIEDKPNKFYHNQSVTLLKKTKKKKKTKKTPMFLPEVEITINQNSQEITEVKIAEPKTLSFNLKVLSEVD